eukprot:jgi/Ulvmu1/10443/UM062_0040.1
MLQQIGVQFGERCGTQLPTAHACRWDEIRSCLQMFYRGDEQNDAKFKAIRSICAVGCYIQRVLLGDASLCSPAGTCTDPRKWQSAPEARRCSSCRSRVHIRTLP